LRSARASLFAAARSARVCFAEGFFAEAVLSRPLAALDFCSVFADLADLEDLAGAVAGLALGFLAAAKPETATLKIKTRETRKGDGGYGFRVIQKILSG
jgi:hypothetical protein